jgi:cell division septation protein DedD
VSTQTTDESFREIQLNGKQLVFLFMAATVVSVVIFLCGVLVGRGARPERTPAQDVAAAEIAPDPGAAPPPAAQGAAPPASLATDPPPPADELTYAERLQKNTPPKETLKAAPAPSPDPSPGRSASAIRAESKASRPTQGATPPPNSAVSRTPPGATGRNTTVASSDPGGPGFAVQVAAYADRRDADTLARQLVAKGYPAFVMDPVKGGPKAMYRVRVGKYKTLKDAQTVSTRLETAEQFNPWIAR